MLEEQDLRCAGLVREPPLGGFALLAAERGIREDDVERRRRVLEEPVVGGTAGQCVAVPQVRLVDSVEDEVGEGDRLDLIVLLAAEDGRCLQDHEIV